MEDFSKITVPPLPKIESPKEFRIEFEGESFPLFESLLKTIVVPLGYKQNKKTHANGKTIIPFTRTRLL